MGHILMWATAAMSAVVVLISLVRLVFKSHLTEYDFFEEWAGHGLHGVFNLLMSLMMLELFWTSIKWSALLFYIFSAVFFVRGLKTTRNKMAEFIHAWVCLSMMYMAIGESEWIRDLVILFTTSMISIMILYIYRIAKQPKGEITPTKILANIGNLNHVLMMLSMSVMYVVMNWAPLFGLGSHAHIH